MISFEEARQIIAENRGSLFGPGAEFEVNDWGWETPERWIILYQSEATDSRPFTSVDKQTGEYFEDPSTGDDPFPDATRVG